MCARVGDRGRGLGREQRQHLLLPLLLLLVVGERLAVGLLGEEEVADILVRWRIGVSWKALENVRAGAMPNERVEMRSRSARICCLRSSDSVKAPPSPDRQASRSARGRTAAPARLLYEVHTVNGLICTMNLRESSICS